MKFFYDLDADSGFDDADLSSVAAIMLVWISCLADFLNADLSNVAAIMVARMSAGKPETIPGYGFHSPLRVKYPPFGQ